MTSSQSPSAYALDDVDKQILFELMSDARTNTAPAIAETVNVSPGTVRNRIEKLEQRGIIEGYHAHINFERTEGRLTTLFLCNVPFAERETIAQAAYQIPGVLNIRIMMGGRRSFHVLAVGEDTAELRRIGTTLSELGVEIEDEMLVESEFIRPYDLFTSDTASLETVPPGLSDISHSTEFAEVTVAAGAPVAGHTIEEAVEAGLIGEEPLIVSIVRDESPITPHGNTTLEPADIVTLFSSGGLSAQTLEAFDAP